MLKFYKKIPQNNFINCVSGYPTPLPLKKEDISFKEKFKTKKSFRSYMTCHLFSGMHMKSLIEKHFLIKKLKSPDAKFSITKQLKILLNIQTDY